MDQTLSLKPEDKENIRQTGRAEVVLGGAVGRLVGAVVLGLGASVGTAERETLVLDKGAEEGMPLGAADNGITVGVGGSVTSGATLVGEGDAVGRTVDVDTLPEFGEICGAGEVDGDATDGAEL